MSTLGQLGPQRRPHVGPSGPDLCATSLAGDNDEREVTVAARQERLTDTTCHKLFEPAVSGGRMLIHEHLLQRVEAPTLVPTVMERQRRKLGDYASQTPATTSTSRLQATARQGRRRGSGQRNDDGRVM